MSYEWQYYPAPTRPDVILKEYYERLKLGEKYPALETVRDNVSSALIPGFLRLLAAREFCQEQAEKDREKVQLQPTCQHHRQEGTKEGWRCSDCLLYMT